MEKQNWTALKTVRRYALYLGICAAFLLSFCASYKAHAETTGEENVTGKIWIDYTYSYKDEYNNLIEGAVPADERPASVELTLIKTVNNESTELLTKEFQVTDSGDSGTASYDFGTLPQYENGEKITYSFRRVYSGVPADYQMTEEEDGLHFTFNPSVFKVKWNISTKFENKTRIVDAVRFRLTYKNSKNDTFRIIPQHTNAYLQSFRQADGYYTGEYSVWQYNQFTKNPYMYSLDIIAYKADGEWHETSDLLCVTNDADANPVYYNGAGANREMHVILTEKKCRIVYNENYGENPKTTEDSKIIDAEYYLSKDVPENEDYSFECWNTEPDGSGTDYAPGSIYRRTEDVTFYAKWKHKEYVVQLPEDSGIEVKGTASVKKGENYTFTIKGKTGYSVENIVIKDNGTVISSNYMQYDKGTNTWAVTIPSVSKTPKIEVLGVKDLQPDIQKAMTSVRNTAEKAKPKNGILFSDLKNLTDEQRTSYQERVDRMIKQTENQLQYTTSVQKVEAIRNSAISQINAIIEQAKMADAREGGTTGATTTTTGAGNNNSSRGEEKLDGQTSVKDESKVSADSLSIREDLPLLLAKGVGGSKKIHLSWLKVKNVSGYEIYWSYCNGKSKYYLLKRSSRTKQTHKKLSNKKKYKYFVIAYRMVGGKKVYVAKSNELHVAMFADKTTNVKAVKVKKTKITLKKGKKFTVKARLVKENKKKKLVKHTAAYRYYSTDKKIAAVSKKGVVSAKKKGTCILYVLANNGAYKKITVFVK